MKPEIKEDLDLRPYTTFGVGGKARYFVEVRNRDELREVVDYFKDEGMPFRVLAGGSNIVFAEPYVETAIIKLSLIAPPSVTGHEVLTDAGTSLGDLVNASCEAGLSGMEKMAGIPGTVGGAVYGSAGAYGHSIKDVIEKVEILDTETGEIRWLDKIDCEFDYRESIFKTDVGRNWVILRVVVHLEPGDKDELKKTSTEIIKTREKKYKPSLRCPGSFFKNVLVSNLNPSVMDKIDQSKTIDGKIPAGWLLEEVGAKGMTHGGLKIADFHGNLLINEDGASFDDVRQIADILRDKVEDKFGITLEEEVQYIY